MKKMIIVVSILFTGLAQAAITNSKYEARHQAAIESAVYAKCGIGAMFEKSSSEQVISIDQGINDVSYLTSIELHVKADLRYTEVLDVQVESYYSDSYDHQSQNWGVYTIESVNCVPAL